MRKIEEIKSRIGQAKMRIGEAERKNLKDFEMS